MILVYSAQYRPTLAFVTAGENHHVIALLDFLHNFRP
jgi:hypothetical protein